MLLSIRIVIQFLKTLLFESITNWWRWVLFLFIY